MEALPLPLRCKTGGCKWLKDLGQRLVAVEQIVGLREKPLPMNKRYEAAIRALAAGDPKPLNKLFLERQKSKEKIPKGGSIHDGEGNL